MLNNNLKYYKNEPLNKKLDFFREQSTQQEKSISPKLYIVVVIIAPAEF